MYVLTITTYLVIGLIAGIIIDKSWLTTEQIQYVQKLKEENEKHLQDRQAWVRYIEKEISDLNVYTTAENEHFHHLGQVFASIGVTLEKLPDTLINQPEGILITLGEEIEETYGLPYINLKSIPTQEMELNVLFISLLRLKEELLR